MINKVNTEKKLYSVISGTIREIFVKPGDKVKEGQPVLILEAMKMRNRIPAEYDGVVKKVNVKVDQKVPKKHLLVEFK